MPEKIGYKKIQLLRELLKEEMVKEFSGSFTMEHWRLLEMRVQTVLMVGSMDDVSDSVREFQKKQNI